jgi:hypothetical protein
MTDLKKHRTKRKSGWLARAELFDRIDLFCVSVPERGCDGWVEMYASLKGQRCVNRLFPDAYIDWKPVGLNPGGIPPHWGGLEINLPDVCAETAHRILDVGDVVTASPTQLAFLIALSAAHRGVWSAFPDNRGGVSIFRPEAAS